MGKLTIQEIAKVLVVKNGLEQRDANRFATELFAIIQERLEKNELVKVKGLGTWKVITVEARESVSVRTGGRVMIGEHSKITFTPDATMKELVNKPFSQFETVVLNDNVEFDDMKEESEDSDSEDVKEDLTEEELVQLEVPIVQQEEPVAQQEEPVIQQPVVEQPEIKVDEPVTEPETPFIPKIGIPEEPRVETPKATPVEMREEKPAPVVYDDDDDRSNSWTKWLWIAFGVICLVVLSALGGYHYGSQQMAMAIMSDTVYVRDTVYVSESQDTIVSDIPKKLIPEQEVPVVEQPKVETPKVEKPKVEPVQDIDKYSQKDERVRLGAYRIVGLDHEVTVLQGQTFYSICRAHLGPDMECYIEVYNDLPRNPQIKAGQVIKIPKLQLKKRKKQ